MYNRALNSIEDRLLVVGRDVFQKYGLPKTTYANENKLKSGMFIETDSDVNLTKYMTQNDAKMLSNQREAYKETLGSGRVEYSS